MPQRTVRLNQLLLQEFSEELHTRWRTEAVRITFTGFDISHDLRNATLHYSVIGGEADQKAARQLLKRVRNPLKAAVFGRVKIKYTPILRLAYDESAAQGVRLMGILDEIARADAGRDADAGRPPAANPAPADTDNDADADAAEHDAA